MSTLGTGEEALYSWSANIAILLLLTSKFVLTGQYPANLPQPIQSRSGLFPCYFKKYTKVLYPERQSYSNIPSEIKTVYHTVAKTNGI